jgi:putative ABC transport system permease protein
MLRVGVLFGPSRMRLGYLRLTLRNLWKHRTFSGSVILTLALGMGGTISVFSVIYAVLIRPLPYANPQELVRVFQSKLPNDEADQDNFSPANFLDFREKNLSFSDLAASCGFHYNLFTEAEPEQVEGMAVSASFFDVLGIHPVLGRSFLPNEDSYSSPRVVVLSHRLWSGEFHRDPNIVGKSIVLNGDPFTVVGVMPPSFRPLDDERTSLWVPLRQQVRPDRMFSRAQHGYLGVVGRLRPNVRLDQARADMNRIAAQLHSAYPNADMGSGAVVVPLQQAVVGGMRKSLLLSLGIVVFVLLIASSNVAILMLARVNGRARELGIRLALGAAARRIVADVLTESAILGLASGSLGLLLALGGSRILLQFAPATGALGLIEINPAVAAFTVALSAVVGLGFGLLPALTFARVNVQQLLRRSENAATIHVGGRRLRYALVVGEVSLAMVLLAGTGLLLRSLRTLQNQPLGFRTGRVVASWIGLPRIHYQNDDDVIDFFTRVQQNLRARPGYQAVALGYPLPLQGNHFPTSFTIAGRNTAPGEYETASLRFVDSGFFPLMNIPLLEGRNFSDGDDANAQPVAIVSESFARKYWPGEDPIGRSISILRESAVPRRIVGLVSDVRVAIEDDPPPTMYVSYKQLSFPSMQVLLLTHDRTASPLTDIRNAVHSVDPGQPVHDVYPMASVVGDSLAPWRFALLVVGGLAALGLILTGVGLFAVLSFLVRERTRELGIRMAVGAPRSRVINLVLGQSLRMTAFGIAVGLLAGIVFVHLLTSSVYAIRPNDPLTFVVVAAAVAAFSVVAAFVPARKAACIEPLAALREE